MQLSNQLYFARYDTLFGYIQHFNFAKGVSVPSWLENVKKPSWLGKKEQLLQNKNVQKPLFCCSLQL